MVYSHGGILYSHEQKQFVVPHNSMVECDRNLQSAAGYDLYHPVLESLSNCRPN